MLIPSALGLLLAAGSGCNKSNAGSRAKEADPNAARFEAIRQAGFPVTLTELDAWYVTPPASDNAAPLYAEAFAALSPSKPESPNYLAENQKALELLHQAAARKKSRYPVHLTDGPATLLPHLGKVKVAAVLLSKSANNQATKARMDLAAQSLLDGFRLSRSLEEEPLLMSHMMGIAALRTTLTGLESVLTRKAFTDEDLVRLLTAVRDSEGGLRITRSLAGERDSGISVFQLAAPELTRLFAQFPDSPKDFDPATYRKGPQYRPDFTFYLDRMEEAVTASALPYPKALDGLGPWTSQVGVATTKGFRMSAMLLPAMEKAADKAADATGQLRAAQAALAVERFRIAHPDTLPDSLGQLVPEYLGKVPEDPFDGRPLRYKKTTSRGYVVYSIGRDRKDDGGNPRPAGSPGDPPDLTFAVLR